MVNGLLKGFSIYEGTPIARWFMMKNPICKWMIQGYPHFRKPPNGESSSSEGELVGERPKQSRILRHLF